MRHITSNRPQKQAHDGFGEQAPGPGAVQHTAPGLRRGSGQTSGALAGSQPHQALGGECHRYRNVGHMARQCPENRSRVKPEAVERTQASGEQSVVTRTRSKTDTGRSHFQGGQSVESAAEDVKTKSSSAENVPHGIPAPENGSGISLSVTVTLSSDVV